MFHDLINLLFPRICNCCDAALRTHENVICTLCLHKLPVINQHSDNENATHKVFYGRINIENATSLLLFEKRGMVQHLIHNLKYRGREEIGEYLGKWLGKELKQITAYKNITAVVPVPLHRVKLKKRGYNQVEKFGKEIANELEIAYIDSVLVKKSRSQTQTLKSRIARWGTIEETFLIENPQILQHAHILLIDDLVTTGATLEACALKLLSIPGVKISIATMAITK